MCAKSSKQTNINIYSEKCDLRWIWVAVAIRWIRIHARARVVWIVWRFIESGNMSCGRSVVRALHSSTTTEIAILEHFFVMIICAKR